MNAKTLNEHLENGGVVQVSTYLKSTLYDKRNAGWFRENSSGELFVRRGNNWDCLGPATAPLVSIRLGTYQKG